MRSEVSELSRRQERDTVEERQQETVSDSVRMWVECDKEMKHFTDH